MANFDDSKASIVTDAPPTYPAFESELINIIQSRLEANKIPLHEGMPRNSHDAAKWFIRLFEGQRSNEAVREVRTNKGQKYWIWPYTDRIKRLTKLFFRLKSDHQDVIIAARVDKISWRGEPLGYFMAVIDETEIMRNTPRDKYHKQSFNRMRQAISGMAV